MNNYNAKKCICPTCPYVDKERKPSTKQYHPSNFYTSQSESETYYDAMDMIGMPCGDTNIPENRSGAAEDDRDGNHTDLSNRPNNQTFTGPGQQPAVSTDQQQQQQNSQQQERQQQAKDDDGRRLGPHSSDEFLTPQNSFDALNRCYPQTHTQYCHQSATDLPPPPPPVVTFIPPSAESETKPNSTVKISFSTRVYSPQGSFDSLCNPPDCDEDVWEPCNYAFPSSMQQDSLQPGPTQPPSSILKISISDKYGGTSGPEVCTYCTSGESTEDSPHIMYEQFCSNCGSIRDNFNKRICQPIDQPTAFDPIEQQELDDIMQNCCEVTLMNMPPHNPDGTEFLYAYNSNDEMCEYEGTDECFYGGISKQTSIYQPESQADQQPGISTQEIDLSNRSRCDCGNPDCYNKSCQLWINDQSNPDTSTSKRGVTDDSPSATNEKLLPLLESIYEVLQCMRDEQMRLCLAQTPLNGSTRHQTESAHCPNVEQTSTPPPPPSTPASTCPASGSASFQKRLSQPISQSERDDMMALLSKCQSNRPSWLGSGSARGAENDIEPTMDLQEPPERDVEYQSRQYEMPSSSKRLIPIDLDLLLNEEIRNVTEESNGETKPLTSVDCQVNPNSLSDVIPGTEREMYNAFGVSPSNCHASDEQSHDISRKLGSKTITFSHEHGVSQETQVESSSLEEMAPIVPKSPQIRTSFMDPYYVKKKTSLCGSVSDPTTISSESLTGIETYNRTSKYSVDCNRDDASNCASTSYQRAEKPSESSCKCNRLTKCIRTCCRCLSKQQSTKTMPDDNRSDSDRADSESGSGNNSDRKLVTPCVSKEVQSDRESLRPSIKTSHQFLVRDDSFDEAPPIVPPLDLTGTSCMTSDVGTDRPEFEDVENQIAVNHENCSCSSCKARDDILGQSKQKDKFIDSIISDLRVMQEFRNRSISGSPSPRSLKSVMWQKPPVDLAYPVSIEKVEELGPDSLFVKWQVHNSLNIAGYEIFLDGRLTNRYFSFIHRAAVICNVDIHCPHRIILRAQPHDKTIPKSYSTIRDQRSSKGLTSPGACCLQADGTLWYPSVFLFEPKSYVAPLESKSNTFRAA